MNIRSIALALIIISALGGAAYTLLSGNQRAPAVTITALDTSTVSIPDSDRFSLVTFWATTCVGCQAEVPHLVDLQNKYAANSLAITAVAMDYDIAEQIDIFKQARGVNYRIAHDHDGTIANAFGKVSITPTTFLINPNGEIIYRKVGEFNQARIEALIEGS